MDDGNVCFCLDRPLASSWASFVEFIPSSFQFGPLLLLFVDDTLVVNDVIVIVWFLLLLLGEAIFSSHEVKRGDGPSLTAFERTA